MGITKVFFRKKQMKYISSVECCNNGTIIIKTNQIDMEQAIMSDNETRFKLDCSSTLFEVQNLTKIGFYGLSELARQLLWNKYELFLDNFALNKFLKFLHHPNPMCVSSDVSAKLLSIVNRVQRKKYRLVRTCTLAITKFCLIISNCQL